MKKIIFLMVVFCCSNVFAAENTSDTKSEINSCASAPKEALTAFTAPFNQWLRITCDGIQKAHFIEPQEGFKWIDPKGGTSFKFHAYGISPPALPLGSLELNTYEPHKYHYVKSAGGRLEGEKLDKVNKMLEIAIGQHPPFQEVYQLDVLSNTNNLYNLFIYLENGTPQWLIGCVNRCAQSVSLKVVRDAVPK